MPGTEIRDLFEKVRREKTLPALRGVRGTYLFDIDKVGCWFVTVNDGAFTIEETKRDADCEIFSDEKDFLDIVQGRRNLITASMQGRVRIHGDVALAQKFHGFVSAKLEGEKRGAA